MIKISYCKLTPDYYSCLDKLLDDVPLFIKEKLMTYHLAEDRLRGVVGKLILKKLLKAEGHPDKVLEYIKQDNYGRPFINNTIDFNIAHSGNYVVCGVSKETKLGIDIEKIRKIDIDSFNIGLSDEELDEIKNHHAPTDHFFSIWTQKEAVSKANGKGLEVLLTDIILKNNRAISENEEWNLVKLNIAENYMSYIAFKGANDIIQAELGLRDLSDIV